jgi:hypothetical protein
MQFLTCPFIHRLSASFPDRWRYNTVTKEWSWIAGSNSSNVATVYGIRGVANASNILGSRSGISMVAIEQDQMLWFLSHQSYEL